MIRKQRPSDLTLTAASSNTALVPNTGFTFGGRGASRNVIITPSASQSGTTTITIAVNDGTNNTSTDFLLTVTPTNDAPTITPIANQTILENTQTNALAFTIGDAETIASDLIVTGSSDNTALVPNGNVNITFGGNGSDRNVIITPTLGQDGIANITISVTDGDAVPKTTTRTFRLTVTGVNDGPTITAISAQATNEDTATPAIPFTINDADTPIEDLTVTASSSDKTLVPDANIVLFGADISRTVTVTPAANLSGVTTITLTVNDGIATVSTDFQLTVNPANDAPTIAAISDQTTTEGVATSAISFKVNDLETAAGSLTVTGASSNAALVPNTNANISIGGTGENRTVIITPAAGQNGTTLITLTVTDEQSATEEISFTLTVTSVNDPPTISSIAPQTTTEDKATGAISFTINDIDTSVGSLTVSGSSSDKTLVPDANIAIGGTGSARTVVITPAANRNGNTTITLTVHDGPVTAVTTFVLTVTPVNDPPVITDQIALTTPEETPLTLAIGNFMFTDPDIGDTDFQLIVLPGNNYNVSGTTVTPRLDFDGELSVKVRLRNGTLESGDFTAKISVTNVNLPPVIIGQKPDPIKAEVNSSTELIPNTNIEVADPDSKLTSITLIVSEGDNYTLSGAGLNIVTPVANFVGDLKVIVRARDDDGAVSAPRTINISVVLPSAIPLISGQNALIVNEDESITLDPDNLTVIDADDPNYPTGFTMNISPGADYSVTGNTITPGPNFNGLLTVGVTVNDGESSSPIFELSVYVLPINDAPQITALETTSIFYEPGTGPIPITEIFECVDIDSKFLTFAEVSIIDTLFSPLNDELIFENTITSPIRGIYDANKGVLSLIGYATPEQYMTAIKSIQYNYRLTLDDNGEQSPISTSDKKIRINLNDGELASENGERSIELETSVDLDIPNAFTPNGDQANDTWAVQAVTNSDQFDKTVIRVYNKRGVLLHEAVGLKTETQWDGTYHGEILPVDTYYYTIDLNLSFINKTYKGAVTILR